MLLALLCRWGSTSQRLGFYDEADRVAARNMLGLLLALVAAQHPAFQVKVFVAAASWSPPGLHTGEGDVAITVIDGLADCRQLTHRCPSLATGLTKAFPATALGAPLGLDKLMTWMVLEAGMTHIFKQFVWVVGTFLDQVLAEHATAQGRSPGMDDDPSRLEVERSLTKYMVAGMKAFHKAPMVSISLDASRIGQKQVYAGLLATPDNRCMSIPPQACRACQMGPNL
jgi:hypothetical protein